MKFNISQKIKMQIIWWHKNVNLIILHRLLIIFVDNVELFHV